MKIIIKMNGKTEEKTFLSKVRNPLYALVKNRHFALRNKKKDLPKNAKYKKDYKEEL